VSNRWRIFHTCVLTFVFLLLSLLYYNERLAGIPIIGQLAPVSFLGLSSYAIERIIFVLLIVYAGWSLGIWFGIATLVASALVIIPRAILISPNPIEATIDCVAVLTIGGLGISLILLRRGWHQQRQKLRGIRVALRTSQESYEELFTNASDAIWVHDMHGKIVIANIACENVSGYSPDDLIGKNVDELISPEARGIAKEIINKLMKGQAIDQR